MGNFSFSSGKMKWAYGKPPLFQIFFLELVLSGVIAIVFLLYSLESAYSAVLGGLIAAVSSLVFGLSAYRYTSAGEMHRMVRVVYQGEILKISTAAMLFMATFVWISDVNVVALFTVFIIVLLLHGFMPTLLERRTSK